MERNERRYSVQNASQNGHVRSHQARWYYVGAMVNLHISVGRLRGKQPRMSWKALYFVK